MTTDAKRPPRKADLARLGRGMTRPILFSAPMVRAILAGTKTQTRRVVKGAPDDWSPIGPHVYSPTVIDRHGDEQPGPDAFGAGNVDGDCWINCPHGKPGDRLWVRETWAAPHNCDYLAPREIDRDWRIHYAATEERGDLRWRPSIHMPRWASRITLEVLSVRVERLQDISEADARAEGATCVDEVTGREVLFPSVSKCGSYRLHYRDIWEQINGAGSWNENPWVWVVEFRRQD
ncbi:MAG TPA: hypothetical protein PLG77_03410 [Burkholderiaceae bacterium]|nr:hypothetical protein [Burkholderiaceae bacterium]